MYTYIVRLDTNRNARITDDWLVHCLHALCAAKAPCYYLRKARDLLYAYRRVMTDRHC